MFFYKTNVMENGHIWHALSIFVYYEISYQNEAWKMYKTEMYGIMYVKHRKMFWIYWVGVNTEFTPWQLPEEAFPS